MELKNPIGILTQAEKARFFLTGLYDKSRIPLNPIGMLKPFGIEQSSRIDVHLPSPDIQLYLSEAKLDVLFQYILNTTKTTMPQHKQLGKWTSTSLVVGNMVGAGIFMMPAVLGSYGGISMVGWVLSSIGAMVVAIMFSTFGKILPGIQGGPYAFTRASIGEFPAFLTAWGYWISVWTTNSALSVAFTGYLTVFLPVLEQKSIYSISISIGVLWLLTWVNTLGVKKVGNLSLITTILKLTPILAVGLLGFFYFQAEHFVPFNTSGEDDWKAVAMTTTFTFFAFLGIESATIPAESVKDPDTTVPFATRWGTGTVIMVYLLSSFSIFGLIHPSELAVSSAPFADAAVQIWGGSARYLVAFAATISVFGALNGWILMQGQMPEAIARDKLFPGIFAKENEHGVPAFGIIISSVLATILILMNYSGGLVKIFEFMILISTVCVLVPYLLCAISFWKIIGIQKFSKTRKIVLSLVGGLSFIFSAYALSGSGFDAIIWGFTALLLGVPVYYFVKSKP